MRKHFVIPDTQVRPRVPVGHFDWIGRYAQDKRPDVIVHLGDWYDMASLCSYDRSERPGDFYARKYQADLDAGDRTVDMIERRLARLRGIRKLYLLGNHEERFGRLIAAEPNLDGALRTPWAYAEAAGWEVHDFLSPVEVDGVRYAHYFCRGPSGTVTNSKRGAPSAKAQVQREMKSCTAGHKQGLDTCIIPTAHGMMRGIIAGSCYQHEEEYLTPQGTQYWRGILVKHEVHNGNFNLMEVSLGFLKRRYAV